MGWRTRVLNVDSRFLLGLYAIIPLTLLLQLADHFMLGGRVRAMLPAQPESYLWYIFLFNLPHIMASLVTYADREYLRAYRWPLLRAGLVAVFAPALMAAVIGINAFFIFIAFYTVYHVLMQQYGVSLMLMGRRPDLLFRIWRWVSILAAGMLYLDVYRPYAFQAYTHVTPQVLGGILTLLALPFGLGFYVMARRAGAISVWSQAYYLASVAIVPVSCFDSFWGYPFMLVLIPRFVHDATAFAVYAVHDHNRNLAARHNWLYRVLAPLGVSPAILCLPLGVALAWGLTAYQDQSMTVMYALVVLMLMHYGLEGVMWKRGSPHRRNTPFHIA
ncbi:MAG: hypothetical protein H6865_06975 [Rhodospirillales bacterium]|nr:hypothetical protein [Alphaproteobacteria bacterium]MCB9987359.1 hypothetical protein [Rhodospirillales bacterium]USO07792.1 MAG: hypothetical protein H6866_00730 [Rhodospirillales bacterium]